VAVLAVVLYHLWPKRVPGGFVGVDVFFAISGYLIIGHLLREIDRTGRVALVSFWARRARRLLPASLLVLAVSGISIVLFVPQVLWRLWFEEIAASALYVQNWLLAANAVDYLGADNAASPAQHFWSLSVEEQFYIVWPLLIIVALAVSRRYPQIRSRNVIGWLLAVITIASFVYSARQVFTDPAAAYFVTPGRAWEFGAGGLLAFFVARTPSGLDRLRGALSWLGLAFLAITLFTFSGATPFPGFAALLPVTGTLLVIWAGLPRVRWSPGVLLSLRPVTWVGDVSYSLYLWHWPPIVLLPYVLGHPLGGKTRVAILVVALAAGWLTKKLVEDPIRTGRFFTSRPAWVSLSVCLAFTLVVVAGSGFAYATAQQKIDTSANAVKSAIAENKSCVGAPAALPENGCVRPFAVTSLTDTAFAQTDIGKGVQVTDTCKQTLLDSAITRCDIGDTANPSRTIALVGDSHAGQFLEALDIYGQGHRIHFVTFVKTLCAGTGTPEIASLSSGTPEAIASCTKWGQDVIRTISRDPKISAVLFSSYTSTYLGAAVPGLRHPLESSDFEDAWGRLIAAGKQVIAIRDTPNANFTNAPQCIALHATEYDPCTTPRELAGLAPDKDPVLLAAKSMPEVDVIDLFDNLCDSSKCHSVIGGLVVYFDDAHLTSTFSKTLAPILGEDIRRLVRAR
jgi:peptidoglycan/LPS O-acetylase OafA/YrhL